MLLGLASLSPAAAAPLQNSLCCNFSAHGNNCPNKLHHHHHKYTANGTTSFSSSIANGTTSERYSPKSPKLHHDSSTSTSSFTRTCLDEPSDNDGAMVSSASAVTSAIRKASNSPVEFMQRFESGGKNKEGLVLPSPDFQRLCLQQLDLFRRIAHPDALLSVYVRPAGSYVMDQLELRQVNFYPGQNNAVDMLILIANFSIPTGLRSAEAALSNHKALFVPECQSVVFPMAKHPFIVGFLVVELPKGEVESVGQDVNQCPLL